MVIIDGKESSRTVVDALDPSRIESISILDGKEATDIYGDKAKKRGYGYSVTFNRRTNIAE
ncbi:hypothetical protein NXY28_11440 [Bacteroides thetaiotaomicron]|nr:hypothetical protein NXY28_11440 [Bacteroides thetaiotaomicron]